MDGEVYTVVGVAPAGFSGAEFRRVDAWVTGDRSIAPNRDWQVVARLGPGATSESVSTEAAAIHARTADALPSRSRWFEGATLRAGSIALDDDGTPPFEATMAMWLGVVSGLILLIASGNVANLLLARIARRRREFAVRRILGSGRGGIVRLLALEGVLLSVGAGLFSLSMARVWAQDWGIEPDRVLVVNTELPREAVRPIAREIDVFERLADRARSLPGVASAAYAIGLPLDGGSFRADVYVPGRDSVPSLPGGGPFASAVGPDYFATVGTRLLRGRTFVDGDREGSERVVVVNETMARTLWPDRTGLGECVIVEAATDPCARVVGVVEDIHRVGIADRPALRFYMPARQQGMFGGARLVVRPVARSPVGARELRAALLDEEPRAGLVEVQPLVNAIDDELRPFRLGILSFGFSSVLALIVSGSGVYSVLTYMVAWRKHEIGVRSALGATRARISRLIVTRGAAMAAAGITLGLALAHVVSRWVEPHLFRTRAGDPIVLVGVAATLFLVALAASWLPSRRAARTSPMEALRVE